MVQNFLRSTSRNYEALFAKFIFYFFKIFGILTVSYDMVLTNETKLDILFKFSWIGSVYNVVIIFYIVFSSFIQLYLQLDIQYFNYTQHERLVLYMMQYLTRSSIILILLVFIFQQAKVISIAKKLQKLRVLIEEPYDTKRKILSFYIANFITTSVAQIILTYFIYNKLNIDESKIFIIYVLFIQYCWILMNIQDFFKFINKSMEKLFLKHNDWTLKIYSEVQKIDKLMYSYSCLYDLSVEVSSFYSLPIMLAIFNIYVYEVWLTYTFFKWSFDIKEVNFYKNLALLIYIYHCFFSLIILVVNVSNSINEVHCNFVYIFITCLFITYLLVVMINHYFVHFQSKETKRVVNNCLKITNNRKMKKKV